MLARNLGAIALGLALSGPTYADDNATCQFVGDLADQVMTARQADLPMSKVMAAFSTNFEGPTLDLAKSMIMGAYASPSLIGDQARAKQKADFRNSEELKCYQGLNGG